MVLNLALTAGLGSILGKGNNANRLGRVAATAASPLLGGAFFSGSKGRRDEKKKQMLLNAVLGKRLGEVQSTRDILNEGIERGGYGFEQGALTAAQNAAQGQAGITLNRLNQQAQLAASQRGALRSGATASDLGSNEAIVNQALQQTLANIALANAQQKAQSFDRLLQQRQGLDIFNVGLVQDELSRRRQMQAQQQAELTQGLMALAGGLGGLVGQGSVGALPRTPIQSPAPNPGVPYQGGYSGPVF